MATRLLKCSLCGEVVEAPINGSSKPACPTCGGEMISPTRARAAAAASSSATGRAVAAGTTRPRPLAAPRPVTPSEALSSSASWLTDPDGRSRPAPPMAPPPALPYPPPASSTPDWLRSPITYVVAGLVVVVLGVMIAFLLKGGGSSTASSTSSAATGAEASRSHPQVVFPTQPNTDAAAQQSPAGPQQQAGPSTATPEPGSDVVSKPIDLMSMVDPDVDAVDGTWSRLPDGSLLNAGGNRFARIGLPYQPPTEYDLSATFSLSGTENDDFVLLIFTDQRHNCTWNVNAWKRSTAGFNLIDHKQGMDTSTASVHKAFQRGDRHTAMVKVRRDHIEGWLDGRRLAWYKTTGADLSMNPGWHLDGNTIGIGCFCAATFYNVELTEVNGHGVAGSLRKQKQKK